LTRVFISPRFRRRGNPSGGTVTLNRPAPARGIVVTIQQQIGPATNRQPESNPRYGARDRNVGHLFDHPGKSATLTLEDAGS